MKTSNGHASTSDHDFTRFFPLAGKISDNSVAVSKKAGKKNLDLQNKPSRDIDFLHRLINIVLKKLVFSESLGEIKFSLNHVGADGDNMNDADDEVK